MLKHEETLQKISDGNKQLEKIASRLKKKFIGIDEPIDKIISNIRIWYIFPELIKRPIIICLWGLTGVGKTDLIRNLVREIKFSEKYVETDLSAKKATMWGDQSVESILDCSSIESNEPGILFLDEIQRFRTIDDGGSEILDTPFQDMWELLSDGKFGSKGKKKDELMDMYFEALYRKDYTKNQKAISKLYDKNNKKKLDDKEKKEQEKEKKQQQEREDIDENREFKQSVYGARSLKKALKLKEDVIEIMKWDYDKRFSLLQKSLNRVDIFEGESFSKLLIFISGNLDEAYYMASINDADIDANIFHEQSKNIKITHIKKALKKRFKPEQIARFGNTHVIYPSLSQKAYTKIIHIKIRETVNSIKKQYGIAFKFDKTVYDFIYRNGVYPSQGVRPVLSTISSIIDNAIPTFLIFSLTHNINKITICYNDSYLTTEHNGITEKYKVAGDIDKIKQTQDKELDQKANISVHEAAHAVVYAVSFGIVPSQIISNCSNPNTGGYIGKHSFLYSKDYIEKEIQTLLAGITGEEIIFGENLITSGSSSDIEAATTLASQYYRTLGMNKNISRIANQFKAQGGHFNSDYQKDNDVIEEFLQKSKNNAKDILEKNKDFFITISKRLHQDGEISSTDFQKIGNKFKFNFNIVSAQKSICNNFSDILEKEETLNIAASRNKIQ